MEVRLLELEKALESSADRTSDLEAAYQAATKEVAEVKQRARALLEEKDTQLQAARVSRTTLRHNAMTERNVWHLVFSHEKDYFRECSETQLWSLSKLLCKSNKPRRVLILAILSLFL